MLEYCHSPILQEQNTILVWYTVCLEKGLDQRDQLIVTLYILSIYPHAQLLRTLFEAHIVLLYVPEGSIWESH